ncbi:MAG: Gfo/Idh/MocA family protein [Anaerolineae bacterium]
MYRHHPQTLKVHELIAEGAIGRLHLVRGGFTFNLARPDDIRLKPELGGGSIWDVGCYPISYARAVIAAEPIEVFGWQVTGPSGVDLAFVGQMRFADDVLAQFDSGFRSALRMVMEFVGDQGRITLTNAFKPDAAAQLYLRRGDAMEILHFPDQELYLGEVEDMADAILLAKKPRVSLADSRGNAAAIQALLRSAQEGRPVKLL